MLARLLPLGLVFLTVACTAGPVREISELPPVDREGRAAVALESVAQQVYDVTEERGAVPGPPRIDEVYLGTGQRIEPKAARPAAAPAAGDITLDFEQADLRDVVRAILGDLLQGNFVVDPDVSGTVTLATERPLPRSSLIPVLEAVLATQGAKLVNYGEVYRITRAADREVLAGAGIAVAPSALSNGAALRIYPLAFIQAGEMAKVLEPLLPQGAIVHTDTARNLLIIAGTGPQLRLAASTVNIFDVDQMAGQSVMLTSLENADARAITAELESIFAADGKTAGPEGLIRFIPIDRLNAVMVIAKQTTYLDEARKWVFRLDRRRDPTQKRLFVYYVQHGRASDIAETLREIFEGGLGGGTVSDQRPGAEAAEPSAGKALPPIPTNLGVRVTADERNNALLISATVSEFELVDDLLAKLDIQPLQVLIEASIFEVTLRDELRYGLQYAISNGGLGFANDGDATLTRSTTVAGTPGGIVSPVITPLLPGFSFTLHGTSRTRFIIDTLSALTEVNMISSPNVLVLDNQVARLRVGDEVPIVTQTTTSAVTDTPLIVNTVQYRSTGVTLEVTPRVNASGLVTLEIAQEVSDVAVTTTSNIDSPTIQNRSILSTVVVQDAETVMLGGLIREEATDAETGIPVLHQLPVIGNLFGQTESTARRTELVVLIQPRVIASPQEARDMTRDMRRKFLTLLQLEQTGVRQPRRAVDEDM
ncbi:MAG: type II secretion system secretin GspD [Kiloniellales bacterium]